MNGVSVIIPCHNDGRFLEEAVESVLLQDLERPFEIIVVDDGSTDPETQAAIERLQHQYPGLIFLKHPKSMGVSEARNTALEQARYPYIFPLDADDRLSVDKGIMGKGNYIDRAVAELENDPGAAFAYCQIRVFGAVNHIWHRPDYDEKRILTNYHVGSFALYRRDDSLAVGGYNINLRYGEDHDHHVALLNMRVRDGLDPRVVFFDEPYFEYRRKEDRSNATSSMAVSRRDILSRIVARSPDIYNKHFPDQSGDALLDHLMHIRRANMAREARDLFSHCVLRPVQSVRDGTLGFFAYSAQRKLSAAWRRATRGAEPVEVEISVIQPQTGQPGSKLSL